MKIVLVVHNVRSALNVGSILRTAEGLGIEAVFLTGYTPYPESYTDNRLPHVSRRLSSQIHKTALGAENAIKWRHEIDIFKCLDSLSSDGYASVALEQTDDAVDLNEFKIDKDISLVVGNEVSGLEKEVLDKADYHVQIHMNGMKESFNVAVAAGIALYQLKHS